MTEEGQGLVELLGLVYYCLLVYYWCAALCFISAFDFHFSPGPS